MWHSATVLKASRFSLTFLLFVVGLVSTFVACASDPGPPTPDRSPSSSGQPTEPPASESPPPPTDPDEALVPVVSSVEPNIATVGSIGPSIIVSGNNFVPRSIVQLDGAPLATTFISGTELRATIPTGKLAAVGTLRLSVGTSPPGGGASKEVTFQIVNPAPQLTSLDPLSVVTGSGQIALDVEGVGFVTGSRIVFGTTELTTTFVSSGKLTTLVPEGLFATSGSYPVKVVSPQPGGGASTTIAFTVSNPSATISGINPSAAFVGSADLSMKVSGNGFVAGSSILFNGTPLSTTLSGTQLRATVAASLLAAAGDFPVTVSNPPPGGGVSAPVVFRVQYPAPQITSVSPEAIPAGAPPTEVTVTGVGFFLTSQISFDNAPAATTYVDSTHLKATLTASQLATADAISIRVVNPAPGGGTSGALSLSVTNVMPSIGSLSPVSVPAGSPDRTITIYGTGFVPTSSVRSNGTSIASTYVSGVQLTAVVPANQLLYPGSIALTVTNPPPGGGTSSPKSLTIGCDTTGVNVQLGAIGTVTTLSTDMATATAMPRFDKASACAVTVLNMSVQQPARYWVVQNTAGVPVTLSAWAVCATIENVQEDAYLTFYKRPTVPATNTERLACSGQISEGIAVSDYGSPEFGSSSYCPGLTKANGGGLVLGVCEKAVVHVQAFSVSSTLFPPPRMIRLEPE